MEWNNIGVKLRSPKGLILTYLELYEHFNLPEVFLKNVSYSLIHSFIQQLHTKYPLYGKCYIQKRECNS